MVPRKSDSHCVEEALARILYMSERGALRTLARRPLRKVARPVRTLARRSRTEADWLRSRRANADLAVFHEFAPPPYGGGNQFLLALVRELEGRGLEVEVNQLSGGTQACLYNSFNFDFGRLKRFARDGVRMVHRVDGPVGVYRGFDDGTDRRIVGINQKLADATILQSAYSLARHRELGLELRDPVVIHNAVDPAIFHPPAARERVASPRVRIITASWSDNPRKGAEVLKWLDRNLDFATFEVTFAGSRCVGTLIGGAGVIVPWKVEPTTTVIIAFRPSGRTSGGIASASAGANSFATDFAAASERFTRGFQ